MIPHSNARASWPSSDDNTGFYLLVILAGLGVGLYLGWTNYHGAISAAVMALRHLEIGLIRTVTDRFELADSQMSASDPNGVTLRDLYGISHAVGTFYRIPAAVFIMLLAGVCVIRAAPTRYKRRFDLEGLIREQAASFRTTAAFTERRLRLVPPVPGMVRPLDYALTPEEWIDRFARDRDGRFDAAAARTALVRQLGPIWTGPEQASPPVRCLFAAFALHLAERRDDALQLLGDVSAALGGRDDRDEPDGPQGPLSLPPHVVAKADAILADRTVLAEAHAVAGRHAYTGAAMMELLNQARRRAGVLAPGQFAWLKLLDRPLWYALHSLGYEAEGFERYLHPNPRVEAVGARDHWAVEHLVRQPVREPAIDRALAALRRAASAAPGKSTGQS